VPNDAPSRNIIIAKIDWVSTTTRIGIMSAIRNPPNKIIGFDPRLAETIPVTGIAIIAPIPRHNNKSPNSLLSALTFSLINGKNGAQQPIANPAAKNANLVANRALKVSGKSINHFLKYLNVFK
jgi:hypothetical protein